MNLLRMIWFLLIGKIRVDKHGAVYADDFIFRQRG